MSASDHDATGLGAGVDVAEVLRELRQELSALREARTGRQPADREQLEGHVRELLESLDELQIENEQLRSENESLLVSQEQIAAALRGEATTAPDPHRLAPTPFDAPGELARLRASLDAARAEAAQAHADLRAIETTRAWRWASSYWALVRRLFGDRG